MPARIQRSRRKGWRLPPGARSVARPGKWGNPYRPGPAFESHGVRVPELTVADCVRLYRECLEAVLAGPGRAGLIEALRELRGRDLACWCAPGAPCHADVLLKLANGPLCEAVP